MMLTSITDTNLSSIFDSCKKAVLNFHIKDFIEIVILAGMLFLAFHLCKGKKAGALVTGLIIITGLAFVSRVLDFTVLYKLFSTILGSGLIAVIIIFQPEIREVLEKKGNGSLKGIMNINDRKKKKEQHFNAIENICEAVSELSKESTGALIVIERSTTVMQDIEMSARIDANVNARLIRTIFFNKTPLHDGAIVISGDKIIAAGCFLPLSERADIDPALGTRHRAAMGMAEKSDAIVIVVSEETGGISVAHDFDIHRNVSIPDLKTYLRKHVLRLGGNFSEK